MNYKMEKEKKKFNWLGLIVDILKVAIGYIAGTNI